MTLIKVGHWHGFIVFPDDGAVSHRRWVSEKKRSGDSVPPQKGVKEREWEPREPRSEGSSTTREPRNYLGAHAVILCCDW